jgi:ribonuclease P protein component
MRRPADFTTTVRRGVRSGTSRIVLHRRATADEDPVLVGFVVSKAVGHSVVRNRVERRLRHLMAERLAAIPAGTTLVVRAAPQAAGATSAELAADLDAMIAATGRKLRARQPAPRARA